MCTPGEFLECKHCPFGLLCIMGKYRNTSISDINIYLCPECGCIYQKPWSVLRYRCPGRPLTQTIKNAWIIRVNDTAADVRDVSRVITDPLYLAGWLLVCLCVHCEDHYDTESLDEM